MVQKIKNKIKEAIVSIKISRFNLVLLGITLLINAIPLIVGLLLNTYRFNVEFLKANTLQIIVIFIISLTIFYTSFEQLTKKKPSATLILGLIIMLGVALFNMSGITFLTERLVHRGTFSLSTSLFILVSFLFSSLLLARYDFPISDTKEKLYLAIEEHFFKNLGIYVALFFVAAWIGLLNGAFLHLKVMLLFFINLYLFKALLSNFRK